MATFGALLRLRRYQIEPLYNSCILPIFLYGAETWAVSLWQQRLRRHSMLLINGVYAASWIYTGQNASPTTRSDQEPIATTITCVTQSAPDAFGSLITSAEDHSRALYASTTGLPKHGEDPAGRDRPGYELSRMIYGHSIWVWRQLNGVRRTEQLGMTLVETATSLTSSGWW